MPSQTTALLFWTLLVASLGWGSAARAERTQTSTSGWFAPSPRLDAAPGARVAAADAGRWRVGEAAELAEDGPGWVCGPLPCYAMESLYRSGAGDPNLLHFAYLGFGLASATSLLDAALLLTGERPLDLDTSVDLGPLGRVRVTPGLRGFGLQGAF